MKNKILLIIFIVASFFNTNFIAHSEESIEEIIKGRKAIFSNNAKLAKRVNILLREFEVEEAEPIIFEMSKNYENLLNYFPENSKEGYGTEALPIIWEEKDAFNALMQKAADDMLQLAKVCLLYTSPSPRDSR